MGAYDAPVGCPAMGPRAVRPSDRPWRLFLAKRRRTPSGGSSPAAAGDKPQRPRARTSGSAGGRSLLRTLALPGILAGTVAVVIGIFVLGGGAGAPTGSSGGTAAAPRPVLGDAKAPVLIAEYGDFQCPSCGAFARTVEPQIQAAYIATGKARLEWHDFAWIGTESRDAANAARCAGDQSRFWEFHDLLYRSQSGENQGAFSADRLKAMGASLGLEPVAFNACVEGNTYGDAVAADFSDVRSRGFNGTPTFLIGGQRIVGAQPFEVFAAVIDAQLGLR